MPGFRYFLPGLIMAIVLIGLIVLGLVGIGQGWIPASAGMTNIFGGMTKVKIVSGEFLASPDGPRRSPPLYDLEESIYFRLKVKGFKLQDGNNIWLGEDLRILDEKQQVFSWTDAEGNDRRFDFPGLLDKNQKLEGLIKVATIDNKLDLPLEATAHKYFLEVTIRDKIGGTSDTRKFPFLIKTGGAGFNEKSRFPSQGKPE